VTVDSVDNEQPTVVYDQSLSAVDPPMVSISAFSRWISSG
jgi:hypothetical protein